MSIGDNIIAVYCRAGAFARAMPLVVALPIAVEAARHAAIVRGWTSRDAALGFTLLSTLTMLTVLVAAVRWWRFDGDGDRVWRLEWRVLWGVLLMMTIQLIDEILFTTAGHIFADLAGGGRMFFVGGAQLLWLFVSVPLFPWYVAMMSEDMLTLPQSLKAIRPRWFHIFGVIFGALLPILAIGSAVRSLSPDGGLEQAVVALISGVVIATTMLITDSAYFAAYRIVRPPADAGVA
ncbi:hypothetical protein [Sphingomonas sp. SRS2]|uniref:hypothetical protein n=1 Tax=Sphingomonas sp. SRS2 TaxID=133190 RepID=UPI0006184E59|nr:hypothetical protein [Sphingomonas sp. SRS2]KKC27748.1 hypothetical protein WP12_00715 [Sphingomonas sp. SRS2]